MKIEKIKAMDVELSKEELQTLKNALQILRGLSSEIDDFNEGICGEIYVTQEVYNIMDYIDFNSINIIEHIMVR